MQSLWEPPLFVRFKSPFLCLFSRPWLNRMWSIMCCIGVNDLFDWHTTYREFIITIFAEIEEKLQILWSIIMLYSLTKFWWFFRFPYDWRTPANYFITIIGQLIASYYIATIYLTAFILFFGICIFLVALFDDYNANLNGLEQKIIEFTRCRGRRTITASHRLRVAIHELIQFHCEIYE